MISCYLTVISPISFRDIAPKMKLKTATPYISNPKSKDPFEFRRKIYHAKS